MRVGVRGCFVTTCRIEIFCTKNPGRIAAAGVAVTAFASVTARAGTDAPSDQPTLQSIEVTGTTIQSGMDVSQSIDSIDRKELTEEHLTLVQEALRSVPGVTLNSGEGGAHGDSVNLRGLSIPDSLSTKGVRNIAQYRCSTFTPETTAVLPGPASAVFGRGSTSGVLTTARKQP